MHCFKYIHRQLELCYFCNSLLRTVVGSAQTVKLDLLSLMPVMTSSNGNISALLALCAGNSPVTGEFPAQRLVRRGALMFSLICAWINGWVKSRDAGDLRRHRAHYDVIVMPVQLLGSEDTVNVEINQWQSGRFVRTVVSLSLEIPQCHTKPSICG